MSESWATTERQTQEGSMDQEMAIEMLRERYARGGLPLDEFRQLMGTLMVTTDPTELQAIIDSLPPEVERSRSEVASPRAARVVSAEPAQRAMSPGVHRISALFGEVDRSGVLWDLGPEMQATAMFGELRLDVRMARLTEGLNVLRVHAIFGEVQVIIPEGMDVEIESHVQFGSVSAPRSGADWSAGSAARERATSLTGRALRIIATATFGEVSIRTR
jgi:hypothetical protein